MTAAMADVVVDDVWDVAARPDVLERAAQAWRAVGADVRSAVEVLERAAAPVVGGEWEGDAAEDYRAHHRRYLESADRLAQATGDTAAALDGLAAVLRGAQDRLDQAWARIAGLVEHRRRGGVVTFRPADAGQADAVQAAVQHAAALRSDAERLLDDQGAALGRARAAWQLLGAEWAAVASEMIPAWVPPPAPAGVRARLVGGLFVVQTGAGDDAVVVDDGAVTVGGIRLEIPPGARLVLRTGDGDDTVQVNGAAGVTVLAGAGDDRLYGGAGDDVLIAGLGADVVRAGAGDDRVSLGPLAAGGQAAPPGAREQADLGDGDDRLWGSGGAEADTGGAGDDLMFGGAGRDYLDGGAGDDLIDGGTGDDTLYGLGGDDRLFGGEGADYLEGGAGDDRLDGGAGADVLSGGKGDDRLEGGDGDDALYSGAGRDSVDGGAGADTLYGQADDEVGRVERLSAAEAGGADELTDFVRIGGDADYQARVRADLDLLAASPDGREMLTALRETGKPLRIEPIDAPNGFAPPGGGTPFIQYNPSWDGLMGGSPPTVVLYHEMAHVYDMDRGRFDQRPYPGDHGVDRGVANYERQAVGLPYDADGDPATPDQLDPGRPPELTENGLRAEMGLPRRDRYIGP
ncbi:M91 family zinc metallopeptidase [Dactylosporangium sp. NPDC051485]|uniref:M91 family zinc metallopeptidase n=1 Tax=Dactylosporangium sp. NPDC051485 TaxID=3154846 RepID=UPI003418536A